VSGRPRQGAQTRWKLSKWFPTRLPAGLTARASPKRKERETPKKWGTGEKTCPTPMKKNLQ